MDILEISPSELQGRIENGEKIRIIDVRQAEEVEEGIIPQAEHIPMMEVPSRVDDFQKDEEIVFVCRSGHRSGNVCAFLMDIGFRNVKNMVGGMLAWSGEIKKA